MTNKSHPSSLFPDADVHGVVVVAAAAVVVVADAVVVGGRWHIFGLIVADLATVSCLACQRIYVSQDIQRFVFQLLSLTINACYSLCKRG